MARRQSYLAVTANVITANGVPFSTILAYTPFNRLHHDKPAIAHAIRDVIYQLAQGAPVFSIVTDGAGNMRDIGLHLWVRMVLLLNSQLTMSSGQRYRYAPDRKEARLYLCSPLCLFHTSVCN